MSIKMKLKKGDEVIVLAGKDKGKTGKIVKIFPKLMKAIVSEINISNLSYYDPELKKGIKIGFRSDSNKKIRINKSSGKEI